ncbi:MAG: pH regulation protein F, partial [Cellulomonadaceae bacterium]|nr:pH regulation protein F [Cellulomonadaceae bacterium]
MNIVAIVATGMLAIAALFALVRIERGPSMLDRTVAFDLLSSTLIGAIAVDAAWRGRTNAIPILVVLAL